MARTRILLFLLSVILVPIGTYLVILLARGYRLNIAQKTFQPTGLLRVTSLPEGAQVYIGGELKTATDSTITLSPGEYDIEIKKAALQPWKKHLSIEAEVVTRAAATLFPSVPSLKAITSNGATLPTLSPDGTKVAFVSTATASAGIYVLDLTESPLGLLNRDPRLISPMNNQLTNYELKWSPDSKQILVTATPSAYLLDITTQEQTAFSHLPTLETTWNKLVLTHEAQKFATLPTQLQDLLSSSAASLVWSPKENKVLYTATASATLPEGLIKPLPGSSTQPQTRTLQPGSTYVYDLEEDRNFLVPTGVTWFPDSSHLVLTQKGKVTILEYDNTNPTVVYEGPMEGSFAFPYPSGKQILILTNLSQSPTTTPNLYAVSLR